MSSRPLMQVQAAKQTVWATAVTPYTVKRMLIEDCIFEPMAETKRFKDMRGSLAPSRIAALARTGMQGGTLSGTVTYEDSPYEIEALLGEATPSGAGPYVRAYNGGLTSAPTPRIQTFAYGEATDGVYQAVGVIASRLRYSVRRGEELKFVMDMLGKQINSGASLAALSDRDVTPVMGSDCKVYFDAWGGTVGTTELAAAVYSFDLTIDTKRELKWYLGQQAAGAYRDQEEWDFTLQLVMEFMAASPNTAAQLNAILALTGGTLYNKQVRLKASTDVNHIWQVDVAGVMERAPRIFTYDGATATLELELKGQYNTTLANWIKASITNSVATLL